MASRRGRGGRSHRGSSSTNHQFNKFEFFEEDKSGPVQNSYDLLLHGCNGAFGTLAPTASKGSLQTWATINRLHPSCKVYNLIKTYVDNSKDSCSTLTLKTIYKVIRHAERDPFDSTYRILLWHGTKPHCIPGIIQNGLIPSQGVQWFGNGVYFADRIGMSAGYTSGSVTGSRYFILAEVDPGKVYKAHHIHQEYKTSAPQGYDSVKGMGKQIPDWRGNANYFGAIMPIGKSVDNKRFPSYDIPYSEYVIYDTDRIIIRFIVECSM